ncbi:MAG TPA: FkbM family methyltransferase [Chitinophagaceae bacterium]|nr:FkbM family methyltransferase [Chitinophagaceae bacterium]
MKLKEMFYDFLPRGFKNSITKRYLLKQNYAYTSFAQVGEDRILDWYFHDKKSGFYVDIGANHPYIYSNTYKFYLKGWKGINVDANPGTKKLFDALRKRDINVESGVSLTPGVMDFYTFENSVFNTMDRQTAEMHCKEHLINIREVVKIKTRTLAEILDTYLPPAQKIDFMSIDVEGLDMEVLQSNNWEKYKPEVLVVECVYQDSDDIKNMEATVYLKKLGYSFFAKTINTFFFSLKKLQ